MIKRRLCEIIAALSIGTGILTTEGCATPQKTSFDDYLTSKASAEINKKEVKVKVDAAILVAAPKDWYEYFRTPLEFVYEGVVALALKNIGVKGYTIKFDATSNDLLDVLKDPNIQTIVVAGHGSWNTWTATDRIVYESDLVQEIQLNVFKKKHGLFIRHTCGTGRYTSALPLGASVMDDISKTRGYSGTVSPLEYLLNPIPDPIDEKEK